MHVSHHWLTALSVGVFVSGVGAQSTTLVSVDSNGVQGNLQSSFPVISGDGRYVAFHSNANNLVAGDTNGDVDVFVRDRLLGTTEQVSVDSFGIGGDAVSGVDTISRDGRYVVFLSGATNLVPGDFNSYIDKFVHDRTTGTTTRISVDSAGVEGNNPSLVTASITDDGRYVAFVSSASNLVAGDTNGVEDIFVHDRLTGTTTRESLDGAGGEANGRSIYPSLSADGRHLSFTSLATNLVTGDTNGRYDVFVRDRTSGSVTRVSVDSNGAQTTNDSSVNTMSADGRYVAFESRAANLVSGDTNLVQDIFVHELSTGITTRVNVDSSGNQTTVNTSSLSPSISADGRWVVFASNAGNLVAGDSNSAFDAFLHDRSTGLTTRVNVDSLGVQAMPPHSGDAYGYFPSISADGQHVAFQSSSPSLAPVDVNEYSDIFVRGPGLFPPFPYCFGHAGTPCPCGPGAIGHGCPNSIFASGALLTASGSSVVSADTLSLNASSMSGFLCVFFQGTGYADDSFGDSKLCLSGSLQRIGTYSAVGGAATNPSGVDHPISLKGAVPVSGATRFYQATYRNADPTFCSAQRFNRTNGVAIVWYP